MAEKKCPKCGRWNAENANMCDCGYYLTAKTQFTKGKKEAYRKIFQKSGIKGVELHSIHNHLLLRLFLSIVLLFIVNIPIPISIPYYGCLSSAIVWIVILVINVFPRNDYGMFVLKKIWIYPIIGIGLGFVFGYILMLAVMGNAANPADNQNGNFVFTPLFSILLTAVVFLFGLIGLYIGKKRVMDEIEKYANMKN